MGNTGGTQKSLKDKVRRKLHGRFQTPMTDLNEPPIASHDKLVIWLAEMAEREDMPDSSMLLRQSSQDPYDEKRAKYLYPPDRQNSASCDSTTSSGRDSTCASAHPRLCLTSSHSLDSRPARPYLSRQRHIADDGVYDDLSVDGMTNASVESLYNDSERGSDISSTNVQDQGAYSRTHPHPIEPHCLVVPQWDHTTNCVGSHSSSMGNLLHVPKRPSSASRSVQRKKSASACELPNFRDQLNQPKPKCSSPGKQSFQKQCSEDFRLDDTLLDGNLADILFSIDALWPEKPK